MAWRRFSPDPHLLVLPLHERERRCTSRILRSVSATGRVLPPADRRSQGRGSGVPCSSSQHWSRRKPSSSWPYHTRSRRTALAILTSRCYGADQPNGGWRGTSPERLLSTALRASGGGPSETRRPSGNQLPEGRAYPAHGVAVSLVFACPSSPAEITRSPSCSRHGEPPKSANRTADLRILSSDASAARPPRVRWYAALSGCEHLLQHRQCPTEAGRRDPSEATHEAFPINCSDLVQHDVSDPSAEPTRDSKWIRMAAGGHGDHDEGAKVGVQLIRGNDHTWARLLDFSATGGIETHQKDITAPDSLGPHHFHSLSSKRVEVGGSGSASSPR